MRIKIKNLFLALWQQGPPRRAFRNFFITWNAWGLFSKWSHIRKDGQAKVTYNTMETARRSGLKMSEKKGVHFSVYKCIYCDGYHLGRNRDNK